AVARHMTIRSLALGVTFACTLLTSCASAPSPARERPQRVADSAPDKVAATRAAAGLHLEEDDQRWGIEAARARKQNGEAQPEAAPSSGNVTAPTGSAPH
ncbi:MAG TPA: hypothetical protein VLT58_08230, partial [Polyangia bacterium]|nr:hypothetical protein [Polyangia bacterium]